MKDVLSWLVISFLSLSGVWHWIDYAYRRKWEKEKEKRERDAFFKDNKFV